MLAVAAAKACFARTSPLTLSEVTMGVFVDYLLRPEHALIMLAAWVVLSLIKRVAPCLEQNRVWLRLLPLMPVLLCSWAVWFPGLVFGSPSEKILLGLVLGSFCGHAYKFFRQTVFGNDRRIRDHPARL